MAEKSSTFSTVVPVGHVFTPTADVTVAELATILQSILNSQKALFTPDIIASLPDSCVRHFTEERRISAETLAYLGASGT